MAKIHGQMAEIYRVQMTEIFLKMAKIKRKLAETYRKNSRSFRKNCGNLLRKWPKFMDKMAEIYRIQMTKIFEKNCQNLIKIS